MIQHFFLVPAIVFAIIAYLSAFKDGKPSCDNYIQNTYLYCVTYLLFMTYLIIAISRYPKLLSKLTLTHFILIIFVNFAVFMAIVFVSPERFVLKHVLSIFYIASASLILSALFAYFGSKAVVPAALSSIALFAILTFIAFKFQDWISSRLTMTFIIVFIVLAITEFIIGLMYPSSFIEKAIILAMLMLICYLVLVKTKRMIENSEACTLPDYVRESIGFIVSFKNILLRLLSLRKGRIRRRL